MKEAPAQPDTNTLLEFLFRLGQALLACGEQTATVELMLRRSAAAYGMRRSRIVAFPTAVFISLHDRDGERVTLAEGPTQVLRLDQIAYVSDLADAAQRGKISPREGLERLTAVLKQTARFGATGVVLGHVVLTVGLALVLMPNLLNLACTAVLGLLVGVLKVFNRNRAVLAVPMPVVAAMMVSSVVFLLVEKGVAINPLHAIVPPLVSFLPGAMLTLGMIELAYGDMVSGSTRLVAGFVQLVLLAFGLAAGAVFAGYKPENLVDAAPVFVTFQWARFAPWIGVIVFGIGAFFHFSAPPKSLGWMLVVLLAAFGAQQTAAPLIGFAGSGFFGMLVVTPLAYLIHLKFHGPPAIVTILPGFWLLVPGAMSLLSVTTMFRDRIAGIDGMVSALFVFTSIALGSLMGASLYKWLSERFGGWRLQIGSVGKYFRRRKKW